MTMFSCEQKQSIYIGYDSDQPSAYWTCRASMIQHGCDPSIIYPLVLSKLRDLGIYWRGWDEKASTEFSLTRFLVPYLSGFSGRSLFCDSDFLWRCNPMEVFQLERHRWDTDVSVVMHELNEESLALTKMNGKPQEWYPKKNWSSLMLFENSECRTLTPDFVSNVPASVLHQFQWARDVSALPATYNTLVGYKEYDHTNPKAVHFTDGGPWLEGYENVQFAEEWRRVQLSTQ